MTKYTSMSTYYYYEKNVYYNIMSLILILSILSFYNKHNMGFTDLNMKTLTQERKKTI